MLQSIRILTVFLGILCTVPLHAGVILSPPTVGGPGLLDSNLIAPFPAPPGVNPFWPMGSIRFDQVDFVEIAIPATPSGLPTTYMIIINVGNLTGEAWSSFTISLEGPAEFSFAPTLPPVSINTGSDGTGLQEEQVISFNGLDWGGASTHSIGFNLVVNDPISTEPAVLRLTPNAVPEPGSMALIAGSMALLRRRGRRPRPSAH